MTCPGIIGSGVPHGGQDNAVEQTVVQLLGHFQSCPLHSDRGDKAQHNTQAAEHGEYHGIDRLVQGTFLGEGNESVLRLYVGSAPPFLSANPAVGCSHTWLREQFLAAGLRTRALSVHLASQ